MNRPFRIIVALVLLLTGAVAAEVAAAQVRIKDIVRLQGIRDNQLVGYGLVVGLNSSGDSLRNSPFTANSMRAMLNRMGITPGDDAMRTRNVAAVLVTANMPPLVNRGSRIDVSVSSIGDASSLAGGTLIITPLVGADGEIYAVAQGALIVSGFSEEGAAAEITNNSPTTARIPNGAVVEKQAPGDLESEPEMILELINPDFNTVVEVTDAINEFTRGEHKRPLARERDHRSIVIARPSHITAARFFAQIGSLAVTPDKPARIVVDERTGTVIIGSNVRISTVAVTHGNLTVSVVEAPRVVQPAPFSDGVTAVEPSTFIEAVEQDAALGIVEGASLAELVNGLNRMGAKPAGIIAILQGIKSAGALQASIVVQ